MTSEPMSGAQMEELDLFYQGVYQAHSRPLWLMGDENLTTEPKPRTVAFLWKWQELRPLMYQAARLIPVEQAERRVLVFANPGLAGLGSATTTLMANLQIINPGEVARTHRHTPSAFRLIVEGIGAYTAVEGEKTYMDPGDFITTPNWTWHDHGNESTAPMVWLDGLDVPLVNHLEVGFYEQYQEERQPLTKSNELSLRLYGAGTLTPIWQRHQSIHSPLLNYKWERSYEALSRLAAESDGSPYDGVCVEYTNPITGGPALATMACFAHLLKPGRHTKAHRHTGSTVYHIIRGKGYSVIAGERFDWEEKDTFVVPSWAWHEHVAEVESCLFSYNDSPMLRPFGLYREEGYTKNDGHQPVTGAFRGATV
jgi:gentisate 1,2-dioxygenase